jgi:hypothetical protein
VSRIVLLVLGLTAALSACGDSSEVQACVARGEKYFKEIGSYPTLSNGQDANEVAHERCSRTTTAF